MAQITRTTKIGGGATLQSNTLARAADVETDVLTLFTAHNNADTGTSKWQVGSFENASSTVVIANNSTGTNDILDARDNGTSVLKVADGGTTTVRATDGGSGKALIVNNGTSTGNILEVQDNGSAVFTVADGAGITHTGAFANRLQGPDGTAAAPTFGFASSGNTDNGMFLSAGDTIGFSAGGINRLSISASAITAALNIAMGSNKLTSLAAGTTAGDSVRFEQLKVLQVVSATTTSAFTTTSSTFQTTNLSASITPAATSNKILVIISSSLLHVGGNVTTFAGISRAGTSITGTDGQAKTDSNVATDTDWVPVTLSILDSPSTTSATTYAAIIRNSNNSSTVGFGAGSQVQSIILIEING